MATDVGTLQSKLTLDFSQFASGMNSAISMVRSFGKQLQKALGSSATQGFSTTNQAVANLQTNITNLQRTVAGFTATMQSANTVLAQFSNVQATTSRFGSSVSESANSMQRFHAAAREAVPQITSATFSARQLSTSMKTAGTNAQRTASSTKEVSNSTTKADANAKKLSNNLSRSANFAKDLKRIIGGIVVSQAFYKILGIVRELVTSSVQFMTNMQQSAISFKYLLGSAKDSSGFLEALQDFAVASPMNMQGAEQAARMLMTMGFQTENTIAVLRVLTDAATVAGGEMSDTVNRIALALGQMLQSGTVKMQEIRQLVNSNIPIFDILQEEMGLTAEQVSNIGDEAINSGEAVTAILRGLQHRFGGASKEMQKTFTGALSAMKDSFYILFNKVMENPFGSLTQRMVKLSDTMQNLAQTARKLGAGGVFEALFPPRLHMILRNVIGAFMQLGQAIRLFGLITRKIFSGMGEIILHVLNLILPPLSILANAVMSIAYAMLKTYPVLKYFFAALLLLAIAKPIGTILLWFWKIIGLGKIIMSIVGYIQTLVKWLGVLAGTMLTHPAIAIITALTIAVLALSGILDKAIGKLKEFFGMLGSKISGANKTINSGMNIGYDPNKILQPVDKEGKSNADKYKSSLEDIKGALGDVGDEASKTKNKLKNAFNQSFDEVFEINPNTGDDLGLSGLEKLDLNTPIGDLGELNNELSTLSGFDFSDSWANSFMTSWQKMWKKIKGFLKRFGWGAMFAGLFAGLLTGNPWIALAAGLAALFWPTIAEHIGLTKATGQKILGATIGALLGGVIAKIIGAGFLAGILWTGIGALIFAGLWPAIQTYIDGGTWQECVKALDFKFFGAGVGALIGGLIAGPAGAALGAAVGGFLGTGLEGGIDAWVDGGSWQEVVQGVEWGPTGLAIGALIGTLICPGLGTVLGGAIGFALGDGVNGGIKSWAEDKDGWKIADAVNWPATGAALGALIGTFICPGLGTALGAAIGGVVGLLGDQIAKILAEIDGDWEIAGEAFKSWGVEIKDAFIDGLLGDGGLFGWSSQLFEWAGDAFQKAVDAFNNQDWGALGKNILEGILLGITGALVFITEPIARVFNGIVEAICAIFGIHSPAAEMEPYGANILFGILEGIVTNVSEIPGYIASAGVALKQAIGDWFTGLGADVDRWFKGSKDSIKGFVSDTSSSISNWWSNVQGKFNEFRNVSFASWCSTTLSSLSNWANNVFTSINDRIGGAIEKVKEFFGLSSTKAELKIGTSISGGIGHANGGVFNREHWARFSEGNKAEAIIPLENASAMQPFVDAVSNGLTASLAPILARVGNSGNPNSLQPLYVGTLIADERSLTELQRKLDMIQIKENERRF